MTRIPILMYHNLAKPPKGKRLTSLYTPPDQFARQMYLLSKLGYRGLSLRQLEPYLKEEKTERVFGITFDDGYVDNLNALPVLNRYGFTATCYIVSGHIGKKNDWTKNQNIQECPLMNIQEIQNWLDAGMSIGSHSQSHAHLCTLNDSELKREIFESKACLEDTFKIPVEDFCFPYGEFNTKVLEHVQAAGYKTAVTTQRSRAHRSHDFLTLPRVHMTKRTHLPLLMLKILTSYEDRKYKGLRT